MTLSRKSNSNYTKLMCFDPLGALLLFKLSYYLLSLMARLLFDKIENKDVVSWSSMIKSYDRSQLLHEALDLLRDMHVMRVKPSEIGMISITHVLAKLADFKLGKAMFAYVMRNGKCEIKKQKKKKLNPTK